MTGTQSLGTLVVVPSDPIEAYERAGYDWLERYYNPGGAFERVFAVSPLENGVTEAHGMTIIGTPERTVGSVLRRLAPDVVRAYGGYWPADVVTRHRVPGVPVVVSVHDPNPFYVHESLRYADAVWCTSGRVERAVQERGVEPSRIRRLPNRVDRSIFAPMPVELAKERVVPLPGTKRILHVGRKSEEKNLDTLIRALRHLPDDYTAIFVGQGDADPYQRLAADLGVDARCVWIDSIQNSNLPAWYALCDCMCTPSRWEGFGIVFIEAAACGATIVTSDIAPMNEYLRHGESAHLIRDYEDPRALAAAIRRVCDDDDYRARLGAGAVRAAEPFDLAAVDALEVDLYRELLAQPPPSVERRREIDRWRSRRAVAATAARLWPGRVVGSLRRRIGRGASL